MRKKSLILLSVAALGVVYGDIGTSPLYAVNEIFFGHAHELIVPESIFGTISLILWALIMVVSLKYIIFVLKADNEGEGGIFALYSLLAGKISKKSLAVIIPLLIFAAGLLFGDGMITPAISVISAVEGLKVVTRTFEPYIVPLTIIIISCLFLVQRKGTAKIGKVFGPIIIVWFITIGMLGLMQIINEPIILKAFNPFYALNFVRNHGIRELLVVLGSVMLVITGGEAMYADMGHFGRQPIKLSWFLLTFPALILNYLGQGAYLLSGKVIAENNIFYSMSPTWFLIPLVILATAATIIASQALISGAFSLASQGVALNLFPRLHIIHTHHEHEGQIYIPIVNFLLFLGTISIVLIFQSSTRLASAYGLAVSGVMLMTSIAMVFVARYIWNWSKTKSILIFIPFVLVDISFLTANSLKLFEGGFIPLMIGVILLFLMTTWSWGKGKVNGVYDSYPKITVANYIEIKKKSTNFIPKSIVMLTRRSIVSKDNLVPAVGQIFWERNGLLPKHIIFLHIKTVRTPYLHKDRHDIHNFYEDKQNGTISSVTVKYGFMEEHNVEKTLADIARHENINIDEHPRKWLVYAIRPKILISYSVKGWEKIRLSVFKFMFRNSGSAISYYGLGRDVKLTTAVLPIKLTE